MKPDCPQHLVCLICRRGGLETWVNKEEKGEVLEGALECSCGASYPIIAGVPRMLVGALLQSVLKEYRHGNPTAETEPSVSCREDTIRKHTMDAFGFEWRYYADYDADNYYNWMPKGIVPENVFRGKIGLEVGCGAGRHAATTARWAQTHYAVDLSYAVDSAFERTRNLVNCHVIQADAFNLPFEKNNFDYVYCLGVLQHMEEPPKGFAHLALQPRKGGVLLVNVYQSSRPITTSILEAVRKITTRMPASLLNKVCFVAGAVDYASCLGWKAVEHVGLQKVIGPLVPKRTKEYSRHSYRTIIADWYDRLACPKKFHYSREDLESWYEKAGYIDIRVTPYWKAFWNGFGVKG